jgi:lysophospholipid acyltransferase (LPLAT)-like uncharacterized protein
MRQFFKRIVKTAAAQWFFGFLVAAYGNLVWWTSKVTVQNGHIPQKYWDKNQPVVVALWHGRLLLMPFLFPRKLKVSALISDHADGRIVKNAAWFYNINTVVGSSTRGGVKALREMLRRTQAQETIFITPDGPKGPLATCSKGTIEIARMGNVPIIPASISAKEGKSARSWDRFLLPKLFNTLIIRFEEPIDVPEDADQNVREAVRKKVESTMQDLQKATDKDVGFSA